MNKHDAVPFWVHLGDTGVKLRIWRAKGYPTESSVELQPYSRIGFIDSSIKVSKHRDRMLVLHKICGDAMARIDNKVP